jgi:hypothetical protein
MAKSDKEQDYHFDQTSSFFLFQIQVGDKTFQRLLNRKNPINTPANFRKGGSGNVASIIQSEGMKVGQPKFFGKFTI